MMAAERSKNVNGPLGSLGLRWPVVAHLDRVAMGGGPARLVPSPAFGNLHLQTLLPRQTPPALSRRPVQPWCVPNLRPRRANGCWR